jgi:hypothetical protein
MMGWLRRIGSFFIRLSGVSKSLRVESKPSNNCELGSPEVKMKGGDMKICGLDGAVFSGGN